MMKLVSAFAAAAILSLTVFPVTVSARVPGGAAIAQRPVTEAELRADIAVLASDAYGGRMPGTAGETLTAHYIARTLAAAGFVGAAADGSYYQPVPLVELYPQSGEARYGADPLHDIIVRAPGGSGNVVNAPLIYVGHGVDASGAVRSNVRGKIALLLSDDRAGEGQLGLAVRRDAIIAAGARGAIIIGPDGATFAQLERSFTSGRPQLVSRVSRGEVEALITATAADALLTGAGLDPAALRAAAADDGFGGVSLPKPVTLRATTLRRAYDSYNVVARLPGRRVNSGTVLLTGHWDHLGSACRPPDAADRICNGAVDNASGIAVLLAVARRLGAGPVMDRDVMIVATYATADPLN